ncbi:hypothetical protein Poli38472_011428 [Pythium oligandrum]|uniref:Uncharacterized protein n=1 Tax=Pythium oligandrum TaxID=41045 RepID=A0A8K1CKC1_PYTOL|nr:hypothetical protein Poli38472_011428 [Pythium oligandrum]|eukprot:TMW64548.1 hypothetical protein Poli38472_011428 [Pythium oligandrum]
MTSNGGDARHEAFQVLVEDHTDRLEETLRVKVYDRELELSLLLKEDELAPLFSGAAWAGTLLWDAAAHLTKRFLVKYRDKLARADNTMGVIELGAGIGVPGMAARIAGARHVVITEQDDLLELMHRNLADNASVLRIGDVFPEAKHGAIHARPLSWGTKETTAYLDKHADEPVDVILSCDCIYEPLYGKSWKELAETMELLCVKYPHALVMMCVERRNEDGIDKFLSFVETNTQLQWTLEEETIGTENNPLQLYYLRLPTTN